MEPKQRQAAVILCGGQGSRLGAISRRTPKCLLRVGDHAILHEQLLGYQVQEVEGAFLGVGVLAPMVERALLAWTDLIIPITLVSATNLGTAGALLKTLEHVPEHFEYVWVSYGDIVTNPNLRAMWNLMRTRLCDGVVLLARVTDPIHYAAVSFDGESRMTAYREKEVRVGPAWIDAGYYLFRRTFLAQFEGLGAPLSISRDILAKARNISAVPAHEPWFDIGTIGRLRAARTAYAAKSDAIVRTLPPEA